MRRLIAGSAILFLISTFSLAANLNTPATVGEGKFEVGLDYQYIFDKDLKYKSGYELDPGESVYGVEIDDLYRVLVRGSYGITDNVDVYVLLGTADAEVKGAAFVGGVTWDYRMKTDNAFAYGGGLKFSYPVYENWILGLDAHYVRHKNDFSAHMDSAVAGYGISGDATFQEWQVVGVVGYKIDKFLPYLGVGYTDMRLKLEEDWSDGDHTTSKYEADDNAGVICGVSYQPTENITLGLEGRFVDETAIGVFGAYRF
ncbi:MAG: hypothetical protein B6D55_08435 [Candidatus Omnitrophica bacterium 4484_70.2]|nr:MAG: hypothetical protein B6D55_08435 [Candidatus Omnitrophica bacterium 4484_70.2]